MTVFWSYSMKLWANNGWSWLPPLCFPTGLVLPRRSGLHRAPLFEHCTPLFEHCAPLFEHCTPLFEHCTPLFEHCAPLFEPSNKHNLATAPFCGKLPRYRLPVKQQCSACQGFCRQFDECLKYLQRASCVVTDNEQSKHARPEKKHDVEKVW